MLISARFRAPPSYDRHNSAGRRNFRCPTIDGIDGRSPSASSRQPRIHGVSVSSMVEHSQELFAAGRSAVVWIIAALLPGAPPHAEGKPTPTRITWSSTSSHSSGKRGYTPWPRRDLIFAVSVRRVLRKSRDEGYLSELLLAGSAAAAGLLVVAMAMQAAVA